MSTEAEQLRILVVDDDRFGRAYPRWMLTRRFAAEVLEADSSLKALEILREDSVDALITDLSMPGIDGLEMLELIRSDPRTARLEVMVASAYCYEQSVRRAIQLGVSDFLVKPFQPGEIEKKFAAMIRRVTKSRRSKPQLRARSGRLRVLLADPDPNFCSFAVSALTGRYESKCVSSALETVVTARNWGPDLLLVSPRMHGLSLKDLLDQVHQLGLMREMLICQLGGDREAGALADARLSSVVPRSFVPETFVSDIVAILEPAPINSRNAGEWLATLEPEILSSIRQVFGMMTETEAFPVSITPPPWELFCGLVLASEDQNSRMRLEMAYGRPLALQLARRLTGMEGDLIDDEMLQSAVSEVVNVVGGRIKECCRARQVEFQPSLPELHAVSNPPRGDRLFHWNQVFRWGSGDPFQVSLTCFEEKPADA